MVLQACEHPCGEGCQLGGAGQVADLAEIRCQVEQAEWLARELVDTPGEPRGTCVVSARLDDAWR